jgi:hypothetical protein
MAAMLPLALDKVLALLAPMKPVWVLPTVLAGMTVAITDLIERHTRPAALLEAGPVDTAATIPAALENPEPVSLPEMVSLILPDAGVDLRATLLSALSDAQCGAPGRAPRVEFVVPEGLLPGVEPAALRPVLLALLRNAIEHAPDGQVFVGAIRGGCELHIIIIDDGPQAAEALTADARTSLARLLALSDASLFVDHRPGDGTTVMLTLSDAA